MEDEETIEAVTLWCASIEDITPSIHKETKEAVLEVTLADVDVVDLINDIGFETLLAHMKEEDVMEYFESKRKQEEGEDAES